MTEFDKLKKGGESGKSAIVPGKPESSYLIEMIQLDDKGQAENAARTKTAGHDADRTDHALDQRGCQ